MTHRLHIAALAPLFMVSACMGSASLQIGGQSVEEAAAELINGDLAQMVGIGPLTTTCDEVVQPEVGTEFGCQSTSGDNQTIEWGVRVDRDDHIDVQSHNVVLQLALESLERDAVAVLYGDNPLGVAIDCGESSRILDSTGSMICDAAASDETTVIHDATITFTDLASGAFEVFVSDEPRD